MSTDPNAAAARLLDQAADALERDDRAAIERTLREMSLFTDERSPAGAPPEAVRAVAEAFARLTGATIGRAQRDLASRTDAVRSAASSIRRQARRLEEGAPPSSAPLEAALEDARAIVERVRELRDRLTDEAPDADAIALAIDDALRRLGAIAGRLEPLRSR